MLIVEDSLHLAELLADLMSDHGYRVVGPAPRPSAALALIHRQPLDGALLDVNLGRQENSFALADELAARDVPFMFLTGYSKDVIPQRFDGIVRLSKPFDADQIIRHASSSFAKRNLAIRAAD